MRSGVASPRARRLAAGTMTVDRQRLVGRNYRAKLRAEMLAAYGGKCAGCGNAEAGLKLLGGTERHSASYNGQARLVELKQLGWPATHALYCRWCIG